MTSAVELAAAATDRILADLPGCERGMVVDSPPGAGKSTLVVRTARELVEAQERLIVIAQTNEQVDDLVDRFATGSPDVRVGRLSARDYTASDRVGRHRGVEVAAQAGDLFGCPVVFTTAAKAAGLGADVQWPWAIVDEAYQMRSDLLLQIAPRFARALFVGDPGQLDPFSTVETDRWAGQSWDPTSSAVAVLLGHNPDLPVHRLPVSWRLPASAAPPVAEAFYPFTGFQAATTAEQRRLEFSTVEDSVIDVAAATGWGLLELPGRHTPANDPETAMACAMLARRILERGAVAYSERDPGGAPVTIAIGAAHRSQVAAIRSALDGAAAGVTVDTANRLQGREFDVTIVWHPLSGRRDATAFHLETGRLCVLTSRHRHACIVVARAGIPELLDEHPSVEPVRLNVPVKFPDGWEANQSMLAHLSRFAVGVGGAGEVVEKRGALLGRRTASGGSRPSITPSVRA